MLALNIQVYDTYWTCQGLLLGLLPLHCLSFHFLLLSPTLLSWNKYHTLIKFNLHHISIFFSCKQINAINAYLSLIKLALAKHSNEELTRIIKISGVLMAIGYWMMSQKISVPGSLPSSSMPGLIDFSIIFASEIVTCTPKNHNQS